MNAYKQVIIELDPGIEAQGDRLVMSPCKARKLWEVLGVCLTVAESAAAGEPIASARSALRVPSRTFTRQPNGNGQGSDT